jgi:hypothetical protein
MARHLGRQGEWPRVKGNPDAFVQHSMVTQRIDRSVSGPLRYGTAEGVGPRGRAVVADNSERSDFGMDRISPRGFDPMGTALNRYGEKSSDLISREIRGRRPRDKE